ncbi:MAG: alpha-ketoacid dehydrogenase subunit beta [Ardenticatenaceae bacterium]|nr:alpha-ketoacid dehydrogenase subunit beta [Ardenticatenaceae bacterium]
MRELTYAEAIREALHDEMARDDRVFLIGEDIGHRGGIFAVTKGLLEMYGHERVRDTPIQELSLMAAAVGAAIAGMRPVVEIMFNDFITLAMDQIVNEAAKMPYMTGGQVEIPLTVRTTIGPARSGAAQHSQTLYAWFCHVPGLKVAVSATPYDAKGLTISALRDRNPVILFEDKSLYSNRGPVPEGDHSIPLGKADVKREGHDVTLIGLARMVHLGLAAADRLAEKGISAEVIDVRSLFPLDTETLVHSAMKTGHVVLLDMAVERYGVMGELASAIYEGAFGYIDTPIMRMGARPVPIPFSPALENGVLPTVDNVVAKVEIMLAGGL